MSWAGVWFFLMAAEIFTLGKRDSRLPGLGAFLQTATDAGDLNGMAWEVLILVVVIVLLEAHLCSSGPVNFGSSLLTTWHGLAERSVEVMIHFSPRIENLQWWPTVTQCTVSAVGEGNLCFALTPASLLPLDVTYDRGCR